MAQKNSAVGTTGEEEKFKCDMNSSLSARINHFLCKMMCSDLLSKQDIGAKAVGWSGLSLSLCLCRSPLCACILCLCHRRSESCWSGLSLSLCRGPLCACILCLCLCHRRSESCWSGLSLSLCRGPLSACILCLCHCCATSRARTRLQALSVPYYHGNGKRRLVPCMCPVYHDKRGRVQVW